MKTPSRIRILVVSEDGKARRFLSGALASEPQFEVITAASGSIALAKLVRLTVEVVLMDPVMSGHEAMETLRALLATQPLRPVLLFSSFTEPAQALQRALLAEGAQAALVVSTLSDPAAIIQTIREELMPKLKALAVRPPERPQPVEIVTIGISTGGPNALPVLLSALPGDLAVPVVIVQHMPAIFTRLLAERLDSKCALRVTEAVTGERLHPGHVWLAPGGYHLIVTSEGGEVRLETNQAPTENSCRPAADALFRSAAKVYGGSVLAVVMTGMGRDGLSGCEAIHECGGQILAQDQATSVVWGMPGAVTRAGLADAVLPLEALGPEIARRVNYGRSGSISAASSYYGR